MTGKPFEPTDMKAVWGGVIRDLSIAVKESKAEIGVDMLVGKVQRSASE